MQTLFPFQQKPLVFPRVMKHKQKLNKCCVTSVKIQNHFRKNEQPERNITVLTLFITSYTSCISWQSML